MNDIDQLSGTPFEQRATPKKLPGSLNVLTILTFIGSGLGVLMMIYQQMTGKDSIEAMEKMQGSEALEKMPAFFKNFYSQENIDMMRVSYENRIPILIISLAAIVLCVYGALQMRQLKKQGFYLWLIGEILPLVGSAIFVGIGTLSGFVSIFGLAIVVLFTVLYARQLKYLS